VEYCAPGNRFVDQPKRLLTDEPTDIASSDRKRAWYEENVVKQVYHRLISRANVREEMQTVACPATSKTNCGIYCSVAVVTGRTLCSTVLKRESTSTNSMTVTKPVGVKETLRWGSSQCLPAGDGPRSSPETMSS
jgi:hypothetical protein